ncbi:hypothetical protein [Sinorhizobium sp. RAC02]|uniref:hypothetical protein n=1 Tax=Sinorhizobium sp. RAC02 TaxID=1842534 RepID=UPI00149559EF|nr:hypothetical protein [Sinorhizobium sp. RAC02]
MPAETVEGAAKDPATMIRAENPKKIAIALPMGGKPLKVLKIRRRTVIQYNATGAVFIRWPEDKQYRDMLNLG